MFGRNAVVNSSVPTRIRKYLESNEVKVFHYSRPFSKEKKKSDNEFADLWIAKTFVVTEDKFPNIQRRLEIVETKEVVLNPLENAVSSMVSKNQEMQELIERIATDATARADRLSMALNGVLDAAVNGGPKKYLEAFLSREYRTKNKDQRHLIAQLEHSLVLQLHIVGRGLILHGELCSTELLALHGHMESTLNSAQAFKIWPIVSKTSQFWESRQHLRRTGWLLCGRFASSLQATDTRHSKYALCRFWLTTGLTQRIALCRHQN